jgi:hypothetical protein
VVDKITEDTNEKIAVFAREIMKRYTAKKGTDPFNCFRVSSKIKLPPNKKEIED